MYPAIDTSEISLLPPMHIVARSADHKLYKVMVKHPKATVAILVKDAMFTPKSDGNFTVLRADAIDFLQ